MMSAAVSALVSDVMATPTLWITERSATMAPTPTATQIKKNPRRRHEARSSRPTILNTNVTP